MIYRELHWNLKVINADEVVYQDQDQDALESNPVVFLPQNHSFVQNL